MVIDTIGRAEAVTTADYLVDRGHKVDLLTGLPLIAPHMPSPSRHHLLEKLMNNKVTLTTYTGIWEVGERSVETYNVVNWEPKTVEGVDSVVFGSGGKANDTLFHELQDKHTSIHTIGDCYQPRDIEVSVCPRPRCGPRTLTKGRLTAGSGSCSAAMCACTSGTGLRRLTLY